MAGHSLLRVTLAAAMLLGARAAGALPPLEQLETRLELSPQAQLAERSYEATRDSVSAARVGLGVSAFGSVGYEHNHEIIDPLQSWSYNQAVAGGGLSMPVLGSRLQLEQSLSEQQVQLAQLDARRQLERRALVGRLRKAYADYWQAQRLELLAQEYLRDQPAFEQTAELRTRDHLLLDADRLELLSGFSLARRDEASSVADREAALELMRELTGQDLDGGVAPRPIVPLACAQLPAADDAWLEADPELASLSKVVALRQSSPRDSALYPVQSSVQVGYQVLEDMPTGQHGSSAVVAWTFQVPLEYGSERRLLARAAAAQLAHARLEYDMRRQELRQQRRELVARAVVLQQSTEFAATRLAAADAAVRERGLRAARLDGDVLEQLQRARLLRYNAAKALTEADKALVYWHADWARFETRTCQPDSPGADVPPPAPGMQPVSRRPSRALYLWRSAEWLASAGSDSGERTFAELRAAGIGRLLISLDAGQVRSALADPRELARAVRDTHGQGLKVELLLGDPAWIEPAERGKLIAIIEGLKSVPFDGLHLDLEAEQLDPGADHLPAVLGALAGTLAAARAASPWPLELSTHPRDLDVKVGDAPFAEVLQRLQISPTLMVYVANPERAAAIAAALLERYPQLSFSVALSLERSLGPEESLWSYPEEVRRQRLERVETKLTAANFSGLTLQLEDAWGNAAGLARLADGE